MKTLIIDRESFLDWYFADYDITQLVYNTLIEKDQCTFNLIDILNSLDYLPDWVLVEGQEFDLDCNGDVEINNVSLKFN